MRNVVTRDNVEWAVSLGCSRLNPRRDNFSTCCTMSQRVRSLELNTASTLPARAEAVIEERDGPLETTATRKSAVCGPRAETEIQAR